MNKLDEELFQAIGFENLDSVKESLNDGAHSDAAYSDGWTALMEAAYVGHCGIADALLKKGANPNAAKGYGWTALMEAAANGHAEFVKLLLSPPWNAKPNAVLEPWTALDAAKEKGHAEVIRILEEAGAK